MCWSREERLWEEKTGREEDAARKELEAEQRAKELAEERAREREQEIVRV